MQNILVFGTGQGYIKIKDRMSKYNILAFIDNDKSKQGSLFESKYVDSPDNIFKYKYDCIVIATMYYKDVLKQLREMGISISQLMIFYFDGRMKYPYFYKELRKYFFVKDEIEWYEYINRLEDSIRYIVDFLKKSNKETYNIVDLNSDDNLLRQYIYLINRSLFLDSIKLYTNDLKDFDTKEYDLLIYFASNYEKQSAHKKIHNLIEKYKNQHIIISLNEGKQVLNDFKEYKVKLITNDLKSERNTTFVVNSY